MNSYNCNWNRWIGAVTVNEDDISKRRGQRYGKEKLLLMVHVGFVSNHLSTRGRVTPFSSMFSINLRMK